MGFFDFSFFFFTLLSETPQTSISFICYTDNELILCFFPVVVLTGDLINNLCVIAAYYVCLILIIIVSIFLTEGPTPKSFAGSQNDLWE